MLFIKTYNHLIPYKKWVNNKREAFIVLDRIIKATQRSALNTRLIEMARSQGVSPHELPKSDVSLATYRTRLNEHELMRSVIILKAKESGGCDLKELFIEQGNPLD